MAPSPGEDRRAEGRRAEGRKSGDREAEDRAADARRTLDRLDSESESLLGGTAKRMADHFSGRDAGEEDRVEIWGRRIGRVLSVGLAAVLTWWLGAQLGWW